MHSQLVGATNNEISRPPQAWPLKDVFGAADEQLRAASWRAKGDGTEVSPEKLLDDLRRTMITDPVSARSTALRLLMILSSSPAVGAPIVRGGLAPWQLRKIDRYLKENLTRPVQLPMLAEQINLSVSHFNRSFKMSRGLTPHQYIVKLRLELAQSLMLTTGDPLCSIALTCGLADQAHLTKLFRRRFGETPAAWRRRRFDDDRPRMGGGRDVADQLTRGGSRTADDPTPAACKAARAPSDAIWHSPAVR